MERYLVFAGVDYPGRNLAKGGFRDFQMAFASLDHAKTYARAFGEQRFSWSHVVDTRTNSMVAEFRGKYE